MSQRSTRTAWNLMRRAGLVALGALALLGGQIQPAGATDYTLQLNPGTTLYPGESVWSPNHLYRITQQADGNLVEYAAPGNKPFWASGTGGHSGSVTQMQSDGNLVVYAPGHVAIWATGTGGHAGTVLQVQDDANVVLYAPGHAAVWATNAQNISPCTDGSRDQAAQYAAKGEFYTPVPAATWSDPVVSYAVELRFHPQTRCAWALATGGSGGSEVWIERSRDGGAHVAESELGKRPVNGSSYTGVFNDSFPYVVRACRSNIVGGATHCTLWF
ncbi:DUF2690 domain-containing protein [Kitasatospora sp. NBC_00374]|uniref:hypothetical protein n=1 Tax=Kitasatospora sp. NBC_00374 TaxID=2975964 RepID=UPI0030E5D4FC